MDGKKIINGIRSDIRNAFHGLDLKTVILKTLPYLLFAYFGNKLAYAYHCSEKKEALNRVMDALSNLGSAFANPLPSMDGSDLLFGAAVGGTIFLIVKTKSQNAKKFRNGREYGSARWGNAKDIEPYMDRDFRNNIILTETERLQMNGRPSSPKYARNKNVLVIGGSGSGKTRFFCKPNLMQLHSSYVMTDPNGKVFIR